MHFGRENRFGPVHIGGSPLTVSDCERDLGVHVDTNLTFSQHYGEIVTKAFRICHMIRRAFTIRDPKFLVAMYVTYVRPILEFATEVWSPTLAKDIDSVESV